MSPEKDANFWMAVSGGMLALWSGMLSYVLRAFGQELKDLKDKKESDPLSCQIGTGLRKDVERIKMQVPSGGEMCAPNEDMKEIKKDMKEGFIGIHNRLDDLFKILPKVKR